MDIPESHLFDFDSLDRETIEAYIADLREALLRVSWKRG